MAVNKCDTAFYAIIHVRCLIVVLNESCLVIVAKLIYFAFLGTVLHMKTLNQTESPIFVILCVLCFQRHPFLLLFVSYVLSVMIWSLFLMVSYVL